MTAGDVTINKYYPVRWCGEGRCNDHFIEFIYCVVVPGGTVLLLAVMLLIVMCCKSSLCKCKKKNADQSQENEIQLENYNSIRRASATLRHMSNNRETPIMGSRAGSSVTLDRPNRRGRFRDSCQSAPGTLQRHPRHSRISDMEVTPPPPPPPPAYTRNSEVFFGHPRHSRISDMEVTPPPPPPPPAYTRNSEVFFGTEFLPPSTRTSVRYCDNMTFDDGRQPLL